jgi:hypothetical protein
MSSKTKSRQRAESDAAVKEKIVIGAEEAYIPVMTLRRYCEITGDTAQAVYDRRRDGEWEDGKQCSLKRGRLWIYIPEVTLWARSEG